MEIVLKKFLNAEYLVDRDTAKYCALLNDDDLERAHSNARAAKKFADTKYRQQAAAHIHQAFDPARATRNGGE